MKKFIKLILVASVLFPAINAVSAAEVRWTNPDKYSDMYSADENEAKFKKSIFKELEKHFTKLEDKLPNGYKLRVNVFDLDLAGGVNFRTSRQIRVIGAGQSARILFKYQVINDKNQLVTQGTESLKDVNFRERRNARYPNQSLKFEKILLDEWFSEKLEIL